MLSDWQAHGPPSGVCCIMQTQLYTSAMLYNVITLDLKDSDSTHQLRLCHALECVKTCIPHMHIMHSPLLLLQSSVH